METHGNGQRGRAPAGFGRRLAAFAVDAVAIVLLAFAVLVLLTAILGPSASVDLDDPSAAEVRVSTGRAVLNAIAVAIVSAGYFVIAWRRAAATPAQRFLGLRVRPWAETDDRPERLSLPSAVVRWALLGAPLGVASAAALDAPIAFLIISVVAFLWFVALVLSTIVTGRGLHDRLSGSEVIREFGS